MTPYADSQGGRIFVQKENQNTLIPWDWKFHPITVKSLTVKVSQKHPSTLTNFLPEEHSIYTRDICQEIGNGHMANTKNILGGWERKKIQR